MLSVGAVVMRVARIEIFGFKSFMERLVLPLEHGVTGIVGPNGCGKSNIVDALRWVLGETRASSLRGGVLEDVIFNGTEKFRPLGLAEVTLTLKASQDDFFADLVSTDSEADLLAEAIEKEVIAEHAVGETTDELVSAASDEDSTLPHLQILQGGLGADSQPDSEDQPNASSAIAEPSLTTEATETAAASRSTLSTRFAWLKSVNEVQVTRRLYRSGESEYFINRVACRLRDLRELFRAVGLGARAYTIVAQGEVSRIVTAKPEERRHILEEAAGVVGLRDKVVAATRRLEETAINVSRLDDIIKEVGRQVNSLKRQAAIARNRQELKDQIRKLECELLTVRVAQSTVRCATVQTELSSAQNQEANLSASAEKAHADEESARAQLMTIDIRGDEIRSRVDALREEFSTRQRQRSDRTSRLSEVRAFALARETEIKRLDERRNTLEQRRTEADHEVIGLGQQEQDLAAQLAQIEKVGDEDLRSVAVELHDLRDQTRRKEHALREARDRMIAAHSRADALQQQLLAASPVTQLRKTLGSEGREFTDGLSAEAQLFVDGLTVPTEFARAVQSVLGERAAFLVTDEPHAIGERFIERAYNGDTKRSNGLALGVLRRQNVSVHSDLSSLSGTILPRLSACITIQDGVRTVAERLFRDVYVAASVSEGAEFLRRLEQSGLADNATVVTRDGELLTDHSFYSFRNDGGVVQLKTDFDQLKATALVHEQTNAGLVAERDQLQELTANAERRHSEALHEVQQRQARARELSNQLGNARGKLHSGRRTAEQIEQDLGRTAQQVTEAHSRIQEFRDEEQRISQEISTLNSQRDEELKSEIDQSSAQYREIDGVRCAGRERLSAVALELERARRELDSTRSRISQLALEAQKISIEGENIRTRVLEEYGQEIWSEIEAAANLQLESKQSDGITQLMAEPLSVEAQAQHQEEIARLRSRIQREGDVDPTAIERCDEEMARLTELEAQRHDLDQAASTLKTTIKRLTETSERRFMATFAAVSDNFSRLMPRLFGGGKGSLALTDPEHPLESGVEIIARPPGKNLKSIDLMSGGEKALCATGMIFAMFLVRPSPLCVLDEVDAPLDEANLGRFLEMIKDMSAKIQFLLITHNKSSMSVADSLVGVTMQEPGASKVIAVSLQDAYSHVETDSRDSESEFQSQVG